MSSLLIRKRTMERTAPLAPSKRDILVETASKLFACQGFHATGIEQILAESGVAKMTLYKHFKSKDELILAALRRTDEQLRNWFMRAVEERSPNPHERLLGLFTTVAMFLEEGSYQPCPFARAAAEFTSRDHPIHALAVEHKRLVFNFVRNLASDAGATDPEALAEQLCLLMEGTIVTAQVRCNTAHVQRARQAAATLVNAALN